MRAGSYSYWPTGVNNLRLALNVCKKVGKRVFT